jgi:hypothetical protein
MGTIEFVVVAFVLGLLGLVIAEILWHDPSAGREILADSESFARRRAPVRFPAAATMRRVVVPAGLAAGAVSFVLAVL